MIYVCSTAAGLLYGIMMGGFKYFAVWRSFMQGSKAGDAFDGKFYIKMGFNYLINIATLLLLFFVRHKLPLNFTVTAIATAMGLSFTGRLFSIRKAYALYQKNPSEAEE